MGSQARTTCCILTGAYHPTAPSLFNARKQKNQCKEVIWKCKIVTPFREMNSCFTTGAKRVGSADAENSWNGDPLQLKLRQGKQENLKFTDIHKAVRKWHPREEGPARERRSCLDYITVPQTLCPKEYFVLCWWGGVWWREWCVCLSCFVFLEQQLKILEIHHKPGWFTRSFFQRLQILVVSLERPRQVYGSY